MEPLKGITSSELNEAEPMAQKIVTDLALKGHKDEAYFRRRLVNCIIAVRRAASSVRR